MLQLTTYTYTLRLAFAARTSRGALHAHKVYFLRVFARDNPGCWGIGECAPLVGLSPEREHDVLTGIRQLKDILANYSSAASALADLADWSKVLCTSLRFATEMALLDLSYGGKRILFPHNTFLAGRGIPINGLIWMGDVPFMWEQVQKKMKQGFTCLKLKVGGLPLTEEYALLEKIRQKWPANKLTLRIDANGAFPEKEARERLQALARFQLHSIEQPVSVSSVDTLATLSAANILPIALDESLIGVDPDEKGDELLDTIRPQYLILKPTLLGGLMYCRKWIQQAEKRGIKWWLTSALESNIGLNAIAQFSASLLGTRTEGLGTGQLYLNNISSPLHVQAGALHHHPKKTWQLANITTHQLAQTN